MMGERMQRRGATRVLADAVGDEEDDNVDGKETCTGFSMVLLVPILPPFEFVGVVCGMHWYNKWVELWDSVVVVEDATVRIGEFEALDLLGLSP